MVKVFSLPYENDAVAVFKAKLLWEYKTQIKMMLARPANRSRDNGDDFLLSGVMF